MTSTFSDQKVSAKHFGLPFDEYLCSGISGVGILGDAVYDNCDFSDHGMTRERMSFASRLTRFAEKFRENYKLTDDSMTCLPGHDLLIYNTDQDDSIDRSRRMEEGETFRNEMNKVVGESEINERRLQLQNHRKSEYFPALLNGEATGRSVSACILTSPQL